MAVPKRRTSSSKRNSRRANSYKLDKVTISTCPSCNEKKLPHRVCKNCGHYRSKEVMIVD